MSMVRRLGLEKSPNEVFPLWLVANLTREGELLPAEENIFPWIDRCCLTPNEEAAGYPIVGDVSQVDDFYTQKQGQFEDGKLTWQTLFSFALELFSWVINGPPEVKFKEQNYSLINSGYILPLNDTQGSAKNIIKTYDQYIFDKNKKLPVLLEKFCSLESKDYVGDKTNSELFTTSQWHLGQVQAEHPLSESQRISLSYFFDQTGNELFTVHGPPGTGKTSLILSVIASKWVEAAINNEQPPIMVAASTNNLAVTNILDNFKKDCEETGQDFSQRWLPDFNSYGLYLAPSYKAEDAEKKRYLYRLKEKGTGIINEFYNSDYQQRAKLYFLQKFNNYYKVEESDINRCKNYLYERLLEKKILLINVIEFANKFYNLQIQINKDYGSIEKLDEIIAQNISQLKALEAEEKNIKSIRSDWFLYKLNKLKWLKIFSWIPFVNSLLIGRIEVFVSKYHDIFNEVIKDINEIEGILEKNVRDKIVTKNSINETLNILGIIKNSYQQFADQKLMLQKQLGFEININDIFNFANKESLLAKLDLSLRYELFLIATHYWEAAWLIENKNIDTASYDFDGRRYYWQIQAMLTPCFVTTLHSGPAFFQHKAPSQEFETLSEFIDLLIVDEAGQVMPSVVGAMLSIAKKALLVGDAKQIEPIFNLPESVDLANAKKFGICNDVNDYNNLKDLGILCSGELSTGHAYGNTIIVGQRQAKFHLHEQKLPGVLLKEHRRCVKDIISYCNELCYDNQLIPMTAEKLCVYPRMGYAHIKGNEEKYGGSRCNRFEAQAIAEWIAKNKEKILQNCESESLDDCIGIITPFSTQGNLIRSALGEYNLDISKVGTVHSLQGAEKPIIIFSSVYTIEDKKGQFFFDRSPNMLNVAVSRAKQSFLVFGDVDIFDPDKGNLPSSLLARYIFAKEDNEITDIIQPKFSMVGDEEIHQINTLQNHRSVLIRSFLRSQKELNIVSPYLRVDAIESDNIIELVSQYSSTININIYTDPGLNRSHYREFMRAKERLINAGAIVYLVNNVHSKIITIDNEVIIEGSFNWLSASRNNDRFKREESSIIYKGKHVSRFIREALEPIKNKVKSATLYNNEELSKTELSSS